MASTGSRRADVFVIFGITGDLLSDADYGGRREPWTGS